MNTAELYISVDVETSGPVPGEFSLLSIGACDALNPDRVFQCELKPLSRNADPKALEISGLSLEELEVRGLAPADAMNALAQWIAALDGAAPVFVGFNAPFDWSFINYYFHRFSGFNPFGFSALDIKALYMGRTGCSWSETRSSNISKALHPSLKGDHDALHDALYQAEIFRLILAIKSRF